MGPIPPFWQSAGGAAAISSIGAAGSGLFGGLFSAGSQRRQYKYNLRLQKQQQDWQRMMWDLNNFYNLPVNEVQRLVDAGINPALSFGNAGGAAAPVPQSGSSGGVSAPVADMPNIGASAVQAAQAQQSLDNQTAVSESVKERNEAEAAKLRNEAGESSSRKSLLEVELKIRNDPEYIAAMAAYPKLRNQLAELDRLSSDLDYQYQLGTYGLRLESAQVSLDQQKMTYFNSMAQFRNYVREYDRIGAEIAYLQAGSAREIEQARVLRQDLDIRAGSALMGTLQRDALQYCVDHGVKDSVTGEIVSFTSQLASEYAAGVSENIYSSSSAAQIAYQEEIYQKTHGQELRELKQEEIRRRGNWYRTSQWNMSINTGLSFLKTAIDAGATVMTRGANKAAGSLINPKTGSERMPLSPEALDVLRKVLPDVEKRLIY